MFGLKTHLDVEVSHVEGMQKGDPVQNLLQQSGDLPFLRNFVSVEYHLQLAAGSPGATNITRLARLAQYLRFRFFSHARLRRGRSKLEFRSNKFSTLRTRRVETIRRKIILHAMRARRGALESRVYGLSYFL